MVAAELVCELGRHFYDLGWASGTGGGICIRDGEHLVVAPSGVQKERMRPEDMFTIAVDGTVVASPSDASLRPSECTSLFLEPIRRRGAGAVIHSHSLHAVVATLLFEREFAISHLEMIKGITGMAYGDRLVVPIIDNTARECDLAESLAAAIEAYPRTHAVLVRRHGAYIWGRDWVEAKTHAECYDYLFRAAAELSRLGIPATMNEPGEPDASLSIERLHAIRRA
ncbi:MAG: methylthioribulose-phosphate dehydratase [Acidobacteriota bacterium]|jgi:methylthioribulose-1-phosphate dehydratase|nr:methylthioribulose-phosphate dehydratase [Acidobacteriota bacterium]